MNDFQAILKKIGDMILSVLFRKRLFKASVQEKDTLGLMPTGGENP